MDTEQRDSVNIGFIGMGLMGVPMSTRLHQAGFKTTVWNRNPEKCELLAQRGLGVAASLSDLIADNDIFMVCVSDASAVRQLALENNDAFIHRARAGQVFIDFSSIDAQTTRDIAEKLQHQCQAHWLDMPVSGGVAGAEQGTLAIMAGGDAQLIDQLRPVLSHLSQRVTRMGDVGSGQVTKICNQMLVSCNVLVMAEVMALAEKAGVNAADIPQALAGGFADSTPLQLTGPRMAQRDFDEVKWRVKTLLKDLDMAKDLAGAMHSATPMAALGAEIMRLHSHKGFSEQDPCTLVSLYSENKVETDC